MGTLRYVKTPAELAAAAKLDPEFLPNTTRQVRAVYETDPAVAAAILPPPLKPTERPEVGITISRVSMHLGPGFDIDIGAAVFGVRTIYDGVEGLYMVTMPMTTESAVVGGRETFGEPKKLAQVDFRHTGAAIAASVTRQGVTYIEVRGQIQEPLGHRTFTDYSYCFKCLPALDKHKALEFDPLLVRLEWRQRFDVSRMSGEVILRDSPFDPVVDLPVRRLVSMLYEEGMSHSSGKVLRSIPAEWLVPYLHQRYDDITPMLAGAGAGANAHAG
ncbi:MAG: acetoacetate decarboxylase family protein [Candidatus Binatia bacterium]